MDPTDSHDMYVGALADSKYDSAELEEVHTLRDKMVATLDPRYFTLPSPLSLVISPINTFPSFPRNYLSSPFLSLSLTLSLSSLPFLPSFSPFLSLSHPPSPSPSPLLTSLPFPPLSPSPPPLSLPSPLSSGLLVSELYYETSNNSKSLFPFILTLLYSLDR